MNYDFQKFIDEASAQGAAGQLLTLGFDGTRYTRKLGQWFEKFRPAGVILFAPNIENSDQVKRLICDLKKLSEDVTGLPLLVCVDQEGGRVSRLPKDQPSFPTARSLGEDGSLELVSDVYKKMGGVLTELGFNVDFAPVLDINTNDKNPIIGDRAFSGDAMKVSELGREALLALRGEGLLTCAKHFPGHGDTDMDSHLDLPTDNRPAEALRDANLEPFRMAVTEKVDFMMTAHVVYPALDEKYPATLSRKILTDLLRNEMGYEGVIVSDDMDMKAIADRWDDREAVSLAFNAGVNHMLVCHEGDRQRVVFNAVMRMIDAGSIPSEGVKGRLTKIMKAKSFIA